MKLLLLALLVAVAVRLARVATRASRRAEAERRALMARVLATPIDCQRPDPDVEAFFWDTSGNLAEHARREALRPLVRA